MYPIPPSETLVQTKTCRHCSVSFQITDKDLEFYEKVSPVFPDHLSSKGRRSAEEEEGLGVKREWDKVRYLIPAPTLCPDCRQQRRLSFQNERKLYKRNCDATGKSIISMYSPDKSFKVYHQDYWWSDKWNPTEYGRDFDFNRGFFEQFESLMQEVPKVSLFVDPQNTNCDYANALGCSKNCYLIFDSDYCEDCLYGNNMQHSSDTVDALFVNNCQNCYSIVDCSYCNKVLFGWGCNSSSESTYVVDLENAHHCFLSHTIYNKSYIFENKECSKEEYIQKVQDFFSLPSTEKQKRIDQWAHSCKFDKVYPYHLSVSFENSSWAGLSNTKWVHVSYDMVNCEDCKYSTVLIDAKDCHDTDSFGDKLSLAYEIWTTWHDVHSAIMSDALAFGATNIIYSRYCGANSSHLFWCIGLRNKSYCILNKQYTKDEYEALVPRIIEHMQKTGEWWEFFPSTLSPFGYNEAVAMEYYPLTRDQVSESSNQNGKNIFNWSNYESPFPKVEKIIPADKLPDDIASIPDDILNWAIECEVTKKPFRIIKQELEFYRKHDLPIPRRHPDQRHLDRMALRNPRKLFERKCDKCGVEMVTTYAPDREEIVYCESCYTKEVLW